MYQLQTLHSSRRNVRVIDWRMFLPERNDVIKEFRLEAHIICNIFHTRDVFWNNYINTTFHIMFKNVYYMFVTVSLVWSSGLFVLWVKHMIAGSSEVSRIISFFGNTPNSRSGSNLSHDWYEFRAKRCCSSGSSKQFYFHSFTNEGWGACRKDCECECEWAWRGWISVWTNVRRSKSTKLIFSSVQTLVSKSLFTLHYIYLTSWKSSSCFGDGQITTTIIQFNFICTAPNHNNSHLRCFIL